MIKLSLNEDWKYCHLGKEDWRNVTIPHDAMLSEPRNGSVVGGKNTGYFEGRDYLYERELLIDKKMGESYILEFEGVYRNARILLNGEEVSFRPYGYTNFYVDITRKVKDGSNTLQVKAFNSDLPNSRWYSGAGMYRPAWLYILPEKHIKINGVRIKTKNALNGVLEASVATSCKGRVRVEIYDGETLVDHDEQMGSGDVTCLIHIKNPKLWSVDTPYLYMAKVIFEGDEQVVPFGIRQIACDAENGFTLNGERIILRGACIHHDNGVLGACAYAEAEERKVRILQEAGYNALRIAHNPCSKALLDACDKLGMLVMDEYADMWYVHKCQYDYATYLKDWWKQDLKDLVEKDFNHPSVIMYSTGNEVGETSEKKGIDMTGQFTRYLHSLDDTRFVTCGINIWFNAMYKMGFGQYSDEKAKKQAKAKSDKDKNKQAVGSEFFNNLAGMVGANFMKTMATLPICDTVTKDAYANMDVAGYNYGIKRYRRDLRKYPDRVICGSETFVSDAYTFWELAKENNALVGDFVWAGMDYLGECGIGAMEYKDYAKNFTGDYGWIAAGSGRVDFTGKETAEAKYTKVAYELLPIAIGVVPVNHTKDNHSPSAWSMTNAKESWSWNGCEGKKAKVEVYTRAKKVKLFWNDTLIGEKKPKKDCKVIFHTTYHPGTLTAIGYNEKNDEVCRTQLKTAGEETKLTLLPERVGNLCFVRLQYTDDNGIVKPLERGDIHLDVQGGKLLGFGSACPYNENGFLRDTSDTYFGEALAVIRAAGKRVIVKARSVKGNAEVSVSFE